MKVVSGTKKERVLLTYEKPYFRKEDGMIDSITYFGDDCRFKIQLRGGKFVTGKMTELSPRNSMYGTLNTNTKEVQEKINKISSYKIYYPRELLYLSFPVLDPPNFCTFLIVGRNKEGHEKQISVQFLQHAPPLTNKLQDFKFISHMDYACSNIEVRFELKIRYEDLQKSLDILKAENQGTKIFNMRGGPYTSTITEIVLHP